MLRHRWEDIKINLKGIEKTLYYGVGCREHQYHTKLSRKITENIKILLFRS